MMFLTRASMYLWAFLLLAACSSVPQIKLPPVWDYEQGAIQLHLASDPQLNLFQKKPHSIIFCLYHLKDPNGFKQLADERDGIAKLLECSRFDQSVTYAKRLIIQPNQNLSVVLDRTESAKFVGIVAGYYSLQKTSSVRSYQIPLTEVEQKSTLVQKPAQLSINLYLGAHEIKQQVERKPSQTMME